MRIAVLASVLLTLVLITPALSAAALIEGRVVKGGEPVPGMVVSAYPSLDFSGEPLATSEPSGPDGLYRLELPKGLYSLFGRDAKGSLFAFCGRNPVAVDAEPLWAGLQAVATTTADDVSYDDPYSGAIEGEVLFGGRPVAGATVYLYLDPVEDLKGQGYRSSPPTGEDGFFAFDGLPESDYFLVARKRQSGARVGPVVEGDLLGVFPGNPLTVRAGRTAKIRLPMVAKLREAEGEALFGRPSGILLSGRVVDRDGEPVPGVHVFAYTERVIGHKRPAALSAPTGVDGAYRIHLPEPGTYYVGARLNYGDSPAPGELFGMYEGSADHGLAVKEGEKREGVRIVVEPVSF